MFMKTAYNLKHELNNDNDLVFKILNNLLAS